MKKLKELFFRAKQADGWLAMTFMPEMACLAHVERVSDGKPIVHYCTMEPVSLSDPTGLARLVLEKNLTRYKSIALLNLGEYQVLQVEAPNVRPEELRTAIRWRIKDLLDYHIDDATLDVLNIPPGKDGGRSTLMYAVASRNETIQRYVTSCEEVKLPLTVIDIPEMAQRNVAQMLEEPERGLVLLSFSEEGGLLTFTSNGELYLSRHIDAPVLQLMQDDMGKRQRYFDRIATELQRSLDHFDRQFSYIPLSRLVLAPLPLETGLREHLMANLEIRVDELNLDEIFDFSRVPELQADQKAQCFLTLSAALRMELGTL